jgi:hypothetical protein
MHLRRAGSMLLQVLARVYGAQPGRLTSPGFGGGRGGFWEDRGYEWYAGI